MLWYIQCPKVVSYMVILVHFGCCAVLSFCRSVVLSFCRSLVLSFCRSVVVSSSPPVRRLITCIDTLYEHNVKVIVSADAPITEVFQPYGEVGGDHQGRYEQAATEGQGDLLGKFLVMRWCFKFTKLVFPSDVLCFFLSSPLPVQAQKNTCKPQKTSFLRLTEQSRV